ncbi:hypothetical protein E7744_06940 [Citricoccus sp. SGAir0253]|uniref:hypothetical protein n=1 Tax=Citricoccus sp. SGAir0253 TaxID=2567881 RepID=UPI0010CD4DF7|nr:hypothetical protein [Citricoccus sp. SGAir0253]QCU77947.1 hypothetical protein E7744_06940 [Citricoccus sp. SGAir0253]
MAIATKLLVQFKCGHAEAKDLESTPPGKRKAKAFGLGKNFVCSRCFKALRRDELDRHNRDLLVQAQGFEEDHGLPELSGSEGQVPWATRLRYQVLTDLIEAADSHRPVFDPGQVIEVAKSLVRAGWWIDNTRDPDLTVDDLLTLITTAIDEDDLVATENPF